MTVVEKITTHILCPITFYRKSCLWRYNVEKYRRAAQTTWLHGACALHYRYLRQQHTPGLCDSYCFLAAKMVARNSLNVTLNAHWLVTADKSLDRQGRKQAREQVRGARDFNNITTRAIINFFFLQGKAPKEIHAILTETLVFPSWSG